jgi:hypothetical protein
VILGAALLVLVALGLFVGGIATGATAFYWACVAVSVLAAVLLFVVWRQLGHAADETPEVRSAARPAGRAAGERRPGATAVVLSKAPPADVVDAEPEFAEAEREPVAGPDSAARHRSPDAGEGRVAAPDQRVAAPDQHEPVGRVAGATAAGAAEERADASVAGAPGVPPLADDGDEPPVEEVEVTDLLLVVDLRDEVLVVDEHPRYHVDGCPWLIGRTTIPLPLDEARTDGFTPCGQCTPDRHLAQVERARRAGGPAT